MLYTWCCGGERPLLLCHTDVDGFMYVTHLIQAAVCPRAVRRPQTSLLTDRQFNHYIYIYILYLLSKVLNNFSSMHVNKAGEALTSF